MTSPGTRNDRGPAAQSAVDLARAVLDTWSGAALLIEPQSALLVAISAPARALFANFGTSLPLHLDGAMPAVRTLRSMICSSSMPTEPLPLVFWTAEGVRTLWVKVERVESGGPSPLLLVMAVADSKPVTTPTTEPAALPRSDEETPLELATGLQEGRQHHISMPSTVGGEEIGKEDYPRGIDLAKLAHELKTPVSAIAAAAEIMKDGRFGKVGNKRYAGYIADIHESARHALNLIERMLDRHGNAATMANLELKFETIELDDLVETCISTVRTLALAKGLMLTVTRSSTPVTIISDATALKQIVLNLVTNAIKFTPTNGRIFVGTALSAQGAAILSVEDSGPGMTDAEVAAALRPVPIEVPVAREGGGLGLGLPMSRSLAQIIGAQLAIESAPGGGTRVTVTFSKSNSDALAM